MTNSTPHAHREEIRAREAAATPGPWTWGPGTIETAPDPETGATEYVFWAANIPGGEELDASDALGACGDHASEHAEDNLAFLAHAREDVPALLAELDRVEREMLRTRVLLAMARADVTVEQIAAHYGYNLERLTAAVEGRAGFIPVFLAEIADFTGVTVDWLLNGDSAPVSIVACASEDIAP